jgi:hypothetical protein
VSRDFKAEAIEAKRAKEAFEKNQAPLKVPQRRYAFRVKPEGMTDEQWRHECEIRWIAEGLPNAEQRRRFFANVEDKRGPAARKHLEGEVLRIWQTRKQA